MAFGRKSTLFLNEVKLYLHDVTLFYVADSSPKLLSLLPECVGALCDCLTSFVYHLDFLLASHTLIPVILR